jgi:hypothetical protein
MNKLQAEQLITSLLWVSTAGEINDTHAAAHGSAHGSVNDNSLIE